MQDPTLKSRGLADSDATSDETLHDLEEKESESTTGGTSGDAAPSPDGSLEKDEGRRMKDEE